MECLKTPPPFAVGGVFVCIIRAGFDNSYLREEGIGVGFSMTLWNRTASKCAPFRAVGEAGGTLLQDRNWPGFCVIRTLVVTVFRYQEECR